ncbi:hypothetical protein EK904_004268 [Melospiza melodia maxima]|nr:hypothetical protein EK904_004268 [Melospiza melodia maxima]
MYGQTALSFPVATSRPACYCCPNIFSSSLRWVVHAAGAGQCMALPGLWFKCGPTLLEQPLSRSRGDSSACPGARDCLLGVGFHTFPEELPSRPEGWEPSAPEQVPSRVQWETEFGNSCLRTGMREGVPFPPRGWEW